MSVTAIVQARMGSTRLPGKVLMDLAGRPVLEWVMRRLGRAASLTSTLVATSTLPGDDPIAELCQRRGWTVFRGSEEDVLDRYYQAARAHPTDVVVRVTSDCPLIDPAVLDEVVSARAATPAVDYASNALEPRTFPRGLDVEAFTFAALEEAWRLDDSAWREHVTPFIYRSADRFRTRAVTHSTDLSHLRWTLDTPSDLEAIRTLVDRVPDPEAPWTDYLAAIRREPSIAGINSDVTQKDITR